MVTLAGDDPPVGEPEVLDELGLTDGLDFFTCFVSDN
jgi:hypothetical protein